MTLTTLKNPVATSLSVPEPSQSLLKLIMFSLQLDQPKPRQLLLAIRIEWVDRILGQSQIHSSGQSTAGILHLDNSDITVIDLLHCMTGKAVQSPEYVLVLRTEAEMVGIPLTEPPSLLEAEAANIRQLPAKYRQMDELSMATHVAQVNDEDQILTVFLLDPVALYQMV